MISAANPTYPPLALSANITGEVEALSRRPRKRASAQQVDVQMKYRLSGTRTDVQHGSISLFDIALERDLRSCEMAAADDFCIRFFRFF